MRFNTCIPLAVILLIAVTLNPAAENGYRLVWSDEFAENKLDTSRWEYMTGDGTDYQLPAGWGNNELQWYRSENVAIENGHLVIHVIKEPFSGKNYTSARIRSRHKGDWMYGRIELKIKFPAGQGIWSAAWLLPTENRYGGWAASGEIDIVEHLGHRTDQVYGTLHYGGPWPENKHSGSRFTLSKGNFSDAFHRFVLEWEQGMIKWLIDDSLYQTQKDWYSTNGIYPAPFDRRFHLLINVAVGGDWPGPPNNSTTFPQKLEVDYVRVYQKGRL